MPRPAARKHGRHAERRRRRRLPAGTLTALALLVVAVLLVVRGVQHHQQQASPPRAQHNGPKTRLVARGPWVDPQFIAGAQSQLTTYLAGRSGKFAVAALDLTTGASFGIDQDTPYRAASVNKLELAIDLYQRAAAHRINLDETVTIADDDVQHFGTGTIQLPTSDRRFSWRQLAMLMIEQSDNTASYVIGRRLGLDSVQADLRAWGLAQTSMADNYTTAGDTALLLSKLQSGAVLASADTRELLGYLQNTVWTDRIQAGVPANVPVAHKIGTEVGVMNDAAIVSVGDRPYVLVVLSSGADEDEAAQSLADISTLVYQIEGRLPGATRPGR